MLEEFVSKDNNFYVKVFHFHPNHDPRNMLQNGKYKYVTVAQLKVRKDDVPVVVAEAVAKCSRKDNPSRKLGWMIALGRLEKLAKEFINV